MAHGLSCSVACGLFPDQGSNPCPLHWQADSLTTAPPGKPLIPKSLSQFYTTFLSSRTNFPMTQWSSSPRYATSISNLTQLKWNSHLLPPYPTFSNSIIPSSLLKAPSFMFTPKLSNQPGHHVPLMLQAQEPSNMPHLKKKKKNIYIYICPIFSIPMAATWIHSKSLLTSLLPPDPSHSRPIRVTSLKYRHQRHSSPVQSQTLEHLWGKVPSSPEFTVRPLQIARASSPLTFIRQSSQNKLPTVSPKT